MKLALAQITGALLLFFIGKKCSFISARHCLQFLTSKLNRTNSVLSIQRHFVSTEILRSVNFAIFQYHIN